MALQAYIDDSYTLDGWYVLGGFVASTETWESFSKAWREMLPFGTLGKDNTLQFKMSQMALNPERLERAGAFYRVIEDHNLYPLSAAFEIKDLHAAIKKIQAVNPLLNLSRFRNNYMIAFKILMEGFHGGRLQMNGPIKNDVVDFIFDSQTEKNMVLAGWEYYLAGKGEGVRKLYGKAPRFEDDREFLPLQAADFWAWWMRKGYEDNAPVSLTSPAFGVWERKKTSNLGYFFKATEDDFVENLLRDLSYYFPSTTINDPRS